jgi:putative tryptophan/tyrosine transport system substrate-binding protein
MRRREFIAGLGSAAAWPLAARAQQSDLLRLIGVLMHYLQDDPAAAPDAAAFRQGLTELGWVEGRNLRIDFRWSGGDVGRARTLARELVGLKPDVLLARSTPTTAALKSETSVIPTVFVSVVEPIEQGFVQSLARPGGNITGFTNSEASMGGKWLQLLKEVDPRIVRIGRMYNPRTAPFVGLFAHSVQSAALTLSIQTFEMPVQSDADIKTALAMLASEPGGGLVAIPDSFINERRDLIIALTARYRLPALYGIPSFAPSGGLMTYNVDPLDLMHRAALYVDRILKGDKPADLPVQQPTKFNLVINLKAAKALGLTIPETLLATADEVIQ